MGVLPGREARADVEAVELDGRSGDAQGEPGQHHHGQPANPAAAPDLHGVDATHAVDPGPVNPVVGLEQIVVPDPVSSWQARSRTGR